GVKLRANPVRPPAALAVRANTGELQLVEAASERGPVAEGLQTGPVQVQDPKARPGRPGWVVHIRRPPGDFNRGPGAAHDSNYMALLLVRLARRPSHARVESSSAASGPDAG